MKRTRVSLVALLALALMLVGCSGGESASTDEPGTEAPGAALQGAPAPEGLEAMATDGPGEMAALTAAGPLLEAEEKSGSWKDVNWSALDAVEPSLVAYIVRVDLGGQVALFEVRADGVPHNMHGYQRAFDSGSIIWTPSEDSNFPSAAPQSAGELMAAAAVEAAMRDAFPDDPLALAIYGYRFAYLVNGAQVFSLEVGPDGRMITAGS